MPRQTARPTHSGTAAGAGSATAARDGSVPAGTLAASPALPSIGPPPLSLTNETVLCSHREARIHLPGSLTPGSDSAGEFVVLCVPSLALRVDSSVGIARGQ